MVPGCGSWFPFSTIGAQVLKISQSVVSTFSGVYRVRNARMVCRGVLVLCSLMSMMVAFILFYYDLGDRWLGLGRKRKNGNRVLTINWWVAVYAGN